jgi:hypothetical protein
MAAFIALPVALAWQIATRVASKKIINQAIKTYGKPIIDTITKTGGSDKTKITKIVNKFNKTNKKLEKKSKIEKTKVKKKKIEKEKKIKEKKITDKKLTTKVKKAYDKTKGAGGTLTANTVKDIKDIANVLNKLTLGGGGKLVSGAGTVTKAALKRPVSYGLGGYAGMKAIETGTKLFQGGDKKTTDISNEVTGGGTTTGDKNNTTAQVAGAGSGENVYNRFVAAHNSAMDGGRSSFEFDGKIHYVGPSRLQEF